MLRLDVEGPDTTPATPLQLIDYAGALIQPQPAQAASVQRELTENVKDWFRSCHAVLIFVDCSQPDYEQLDALDLLLTTMVPPQNDSLPNRPLGLVLTKWDRQGPISGALAQEQRRAESFLQSHSALRQIWSKTGADRLQVFPVSSFGNASSDDMPPPGNRFQPCHLHAPLVWAARQADNVLLREAQVSAMVHQRTGDYAAARRVYETLLTEYDVRQGPLADAIHQELAALDGDRRKRAARRFRFRSAVTIAVILLLLGMGGYAGRKYRGTQFDELSRFRASHLAGEQAEERVKADKRYIDSWLTFLSPEEERAEVARWADADAAALEEHRFLLTCEKAGKLKDEGEFTRAIECYREFRKICTKREYAIALESRIIDLSPFVEDRQEYEALRSLARQEATALVVEETDSKAKLYLGANRTSMAMRAEVERWHDWFMGLQKEREYSITVKSVDIPSDSALDASFGTEPRVVIVMAGIVRRSDWYRGNGPTMNDRLDGFKWRWGQDANLTVMVDSYHLLSSYDTSSETKKDDRFLLRWANGEFITCCKCGKQVKVQLRCDAVVPPDLPPYRSK